MAGTRNPSTGLQKIGERAAERIGEPLECLDSRAGPTGLNQRNTCCASVVRCASSTWDRRAR